MTILERSFNVLEYLADHPEGAAISTLSSQLAMPLSATHRLLAELVRCGYVRQEHSHSVYVMNIKLVSLGLRYLSNSGIVDVAQPLLDRLAVASGELVRLAVVDGDSLTFVAKAQGATKGLRYDPDMGLSVNVSCSSAGHAWLSTMDDAAALQLAHQQGFGQPAHYGPNAPTTDQALLAYLHTARARGFSMINEVFAPAMTAMAAPLRGHNNVVLGVVTIAGPLVRLTESRMLELGPVLLEAADAMALASSASTLFKRHR